MTQELIGRVRDDFDLESLRMNQNFAALAAVKKVITTVPVQKPNRQWFIRVRPGEEWRFAAALLEFKEEREVFLVTPELVPDLSNEVKPTVLYTAINRQNDLFLWPVRLPGPNGRTDRWSESALEAAEFAQEMWVRVAANMSLGVYEVYEAKGTLSDPNWPDLSFDEIMQIALKDRIIGSTDHPALKRLRGEI